MKIMNEVNAFETLICEDIIIELGILTEFIPGIESFKVEYSIANKFFNNNELKSLLDFIKSNKFDLRLIGTVCNTFKFDEFITILKNKIDGDYDNFF